MSDFLKYLVGQITGNEDFSIEETEEDDAIVYSILLNESDYPSIIGKRGLTIKAITALCRIKERAQQPLNGARFYIKVDTKNA